LKRLVPHLVIRPMLRSYFGEWRPFSTGSNVFYRRVGSTALPEAITEATWERLEGAEPSTRLWLQSKAVSGG